MDEVSDRKYLECKCSRDKIWSKQTKNKTRKEETDDKNRHHHDDQESRDKPKCAWQSSRVWAFSKPGNLRRSDGSKNIERYSHDHSCPKCRTIYSDIRRRQKYTNHHDIHVGHDEISKAGYKHRQPHVEKLTHTNMRAFFWSMRKTIHYPDKKPEPYNSDQVLTDDKYSPRFKNTRSSKNKKNTQWDNPYEGDCYSDSFSTKRLTHAAKVLNDHVSQARKRNTEAGKTNQRDICRITRWEKYLTQNWS